MSNVSTAALPLIVPFFGAAVLISCSVSCCLYRRAARSYAVLTDRVAALEARPAVAAPTPQATVVPVYNVPAYAGGVQYRTAASPYYAPVASAPPFPQGQQSPRAMNF